MKKSRRQSRPGLKSSHKILFQGDKFVATKVGEVYWVIRGLHWKIKKYFFVINCFLLTQVDKLLNTPSKCRWVRTYATYILNMCKHASTLSCIYINTKNASMRTWGMLMYIRKVKYTHTYTYVGYIRTHTYIHTHTFIPLLTYVHTCICIYIHT